MASNNSNDPWALLPPLSDSRPNLASTTLMTPQQGMASYHPVTPQSQAREPGTATDRLDIRSFMGSGRGKAFLQRLAGVEISQGSNPRRQPLPGSTTREPPVYDAAIMSLAGKSFDMQVMLGYDAELPRISQRNKPLVRLVAVCRPFHYIPIPHPAHRGARR